MAADNYINKSTSGVTQFRQHSAAVDPTVNDDANEKFLVFSEWLNTATGNVYRSIDDTVGAAVWILLGGTTGEELASAVPLGAISGDPLFPVEEAGLATFWLGPPSTPPALPPLKSDSAGWVAPVACEFYAFAIKQTAGIGAPNNTWTTRLNDVAIAGSVIGVPSTFGGYARTAITPVPFAAGDFITQSVLVPAGNTIRNPEIILFVRPI